MNTYFGKLKVVDGTLVHSKPEYKIKYELFKKSLPEGAEIELYAEEVDADGNLAQLAKIHAMIKELSKHTGFSVSEMKMVVKDKAGLCLARTKAGKEYFLCKSFGDCSKEELSAAITAAIEIGEEVNHPIQ
jgi:hypothetical protein